MLEWLAMTAIFIQQSVQQFSKRTQGEAATIGLWIQITLYESGSWLYTFLSLDPDQGF